jgi:formamidopyrimidine-DNA glycosylase
LPVKLLDKGSGPSLLRELPEVETSLRGISPHIKNQIVTQVIIRQPQLRFFI